MALYAVALLFGTRVAETILASVHVRAHPQAGHMDASNLIKALQNTLRGGDRPHMGLGLVGHLALILPFWLRQLMSRRQLREANRRS